MSEFEKLIDGENQTIICPSCGAVMPIKAKKCSFCGYINEAGDELKYQEKLEDIREDLEDLGDMPEEVYVSETKKNVRKIAIIAAVCGLLIVIIAGMIFIISPFMRSHKEKSLNKVITSEREMYAKLDEMYAQGDYEAIARFYDDFYMGDDWEKYHIAGWKHDKFIEVYRAYDLLVSEIEFFEKYPDLQESKENVFSYAASLFMTDWEKSDKQKQITAEEWEKIKGYQDYAADVLSEHFHLSREDMENMKRDLFDTKYSTIYTDGKKCRDIGRTLTWY